MEIKEKKCKVCGHTLDVRKENTYVTMVRNMVTGAENWDAVDCPYCGCQNLLGRRWMKVTAQGSVK